MTLLIPAFSLLLAPPVLAVWLLSRQNAPLPTHLQKDEFHGFGDELEPRYVVGATTLDQ